MNISTQCWEKSNLTYDDVRERYEHFRARCSSNSNRAKIFKYNKTLKREKTDALNHWLVRNQNASLKLFHKHLNVNFSNGQNMQETQTKNLKVSLHIFN